MLEKSTMPTDGDVHDTMNPPSSRTTDGSVIVSAATKSSSEPPASLPTSTSHTLSGPPSATRSNGLVIPLVDTTAGS